MNSLRNYKTVLSLLLGLTLCIKNLSAQLNERDFISYTIKEGLSDNYVTCLQQDQWGYLWIGTDVGLNRFDGNSFQKFFQGSESLSLLSGKILRLKNFNQGNLGIFSRGGFQLLNTNDLSIRNFLIPDSTAFTTYRNMPWDGVQLSDGSFALTTASGFYVFEKPGKIGYRHDAYSIEDIGKKRILYGRDILSINDSDNLVYLEGGKLAYYNRKTNYFQELKAPDFQWAVFQHPPANYQDHWISKSAITDHEFLFVNLEENTVTYYDHRSRRSVNSNLPFRAKDELDWESKITVLDDSSFALNGANSGLYLLHLDRSSGMITCNPGKFLSSYKINCVLADREKRLWIGTSAGLLQQRLRPPLIRAYSIESFTGKDSLTGSFSCAFRYKDKLYAGRSSRTTGMFILDARTMKPTREIHFFGTDNMWNEVLSMEMYYPDTLWLGTNGGIIWFDTKSGSYGEVRTAFPFVPNDARFIELAPACNGDAWFCFALSGIVGRYNLASRQFTYFTARSVPALPFNNVKHIVYDSFGDVWLAGHSLARWNNRSQSFDTLITSYGGKNKFNDDILTISADSHGSLWLHNEENGLLQYRINEKKFIAHDSRDGLPSNIFDSFSPVVDGYLWISSNNSLARFNTQSGKVNVYGYRDGLPSEKSSSRHMYFDAEDSCLYLLCNNEIGKFTVHPAAQVEDPHSRLIAQELVINNSRHLYQPTGGISLLPRENNVTLSFTLIDFESGANYNFAYRLNESTAWANLGQQRNIALTGLPSGNYSLDVRATGKSGEVKLLEFPFRIVPPIWRTTWFITLASAAVFLVIFFLYRFRIKRIRKQADVDKLLAQTELKALHSQMNPHFIFNSLNSISEMVLNSKNIEASRYLSKFAQLIRMTLDQSTLSFVSLRNTMDYIDRYIEMEKIRNDKFQYCMEIDKQLDPDDTVLPPMLIQPFIENSIWHGAQSNNRQISIRVSFSQEGDRLVCIIDDDGVGIERSLAEKRKVQPNHHSLGISNVQNRIRLLNEKYQIRSEISIEDKAHINGFPGSGTLVTIRLPMQMIPE